jgi:hypothetical protein
MSPVTLLARVACVSLVAPVAKVARVTLATPPSPHGHGLALVGAGRGGRRVALAPLGRRPRARSERRLSKPLCPVHVFDTSRLVASVESKRSRQPVRRAVLRIQAEARSDGQGASGARRRARFGDGGRS